MRTVELNLAGGGGGDGFLPVPGQRSADLLTDITPLADLPSLTEVDLEGADPGKTVGLDALKACNIYVGGLA